MAEAGAMVVVMLDAAGGLVTPSILTVTEGEPYGTLPDPSRTNYTFKGWYTDGGSRVTSTTVVPTADPHTLHARWEPSDGIGELLFDPTSGYLIYDDREVQPH